MEYAIDAGADGTLAEVRVAVGDPVQAGDVLAVVAEAPRRRDEPVAQPGDTQVAASADRPRRRRLRIGRPTGPVPISPRSSDRHARRPRRRPRRGRGPPPRPRPPHRPRERRRPRRRGLLRRVRPLVIAAQRRRRPLDDLIARTPADGLVAGVGTVDGRPTAVLSYDYTVLAGTQGYRNHHKKDRLFDVIERLRLPGGVLRRGRRRAAGRHRRARGVRPRHAGLPPVGRAERARAPGRDRQRALLRGQRRHPRQQRRGHRHRGVRTSAWAVRR